MKTDQINYRAGIWLLFLFSSKIFFIWPWFSIRPQWIFGCTGTPGISLGQSSYMSLRIFCSPLKAVLEESL